MDHQQRTKGETGTAPATQQTALEEFHPSVEWTSNPTTHVLRIHLPGFKKEDVKVLIDSSGKLTVTGKRTTCYARHVRLDQSFEVPKDSDTEKITGRYDHEYLTVTMPRKAIKGESSWKTVPFDDRMGEALICKEKKGGAEEMAASAKWRTGGTQEEALLHKLLEKINSNKKVIAVAVAAFTVGFYVSHKLKSRA